MNEQPFYTLQTDSPPSRNVLIAGFFRYANNLNLKKKEELLPMSGIETLFLCSEARIQVTKPSTLSQLCILMYWGLKKQDFENFFL
jgi:hypothetical protein